MSRVFHECIDIQDDIKVASVAFIGKLGLNCNKLMFSPCETFHVTKIIAIIC